MITQNICSKYTKKIYEEVGILKAKEEILVLQNVQRNGFWKLMLMNL